MVKLKVCPKCNEPKLKSATNVSGWLAPDLYECTNCKYIGALFLEVDSEELKKFKESKKDNRENIKS